jgi:hypothetical protein
MSNRAETLAPSTEISGEKQTSSLVGLVIFVMGAIYMLLMGWLSSWWVVPVIRQTGLDNLPGIAFFFIWQFAAPVGALLVAIGAAFIAHVETSRKLLFIAGSLVVVIWLYISFGVIKEVIPPLFGIGGGVITLAFLGFTWDWSSSRSKLSGFAQTGSDLGLAGQVFYLIAAWYLCGLLGAPTFLLRPEQAMTIIPDSNAVSMGTTILICMTLGSFFTYLSRRYSLKAE